MELSKDEKLLAVYNEGVKGLVEFYRMFLSDEEYCEPAPFHYRISDVLLKEKGHFAIEMFRESAKSTYVLKTFPLYKLAFPSDDCRYIVLIKNNQTLADAKLKEIVDIYRSHALLNKNFITVHKQSASSFEITVRSTDQRNIRVRIEAYGKGSSIRGITWGELRPQIIICDDLQDTQDAISQTVTEKDWDWFLSDVNFLAKRGRIVIIGNNLGERCIVERILQHKTLGYEQLKIAAMDDKGKSTWPAAFSDEYLDQEKKQFLDLDKIGIWYRERMCIAMPEETRVFKKDYFRYFDEEDIKYKELEFTLTVDLAISQKEDADETVLCVVGREPDKPDWYLMEFVAGKLTPLETIDAIFSIYEDYRPVKIGIESVAYQKALLYFVLEEQKRRRVYFNVEEIKSKKNKEERIKGLQPLFNTGVIHHRDNMPKLEHQLLAFPLGLHDDWPDALSMQLELQDNTYKRHGIRNHFGNGYRDPLKSLKY